MTNSALFTGLTEHECVEIASCAKLRTFARNELLFMEGEPARNLLQIQTGSVKISRLGPNGNEVLLWMAGSGVPVGALTDSLTNSYTCSARAVEQSKALVWENSRIQGMVEKYPRIRSNFTQILSSRLSELQERFCEVATEKVARRVALALLRLTKQVGKPVQGGIEITLTNEELAQMTGTTLFSISRLLTKWGEQGLVFPRRAAVVVLDAERLGQVSNGDE